MELKDLSTESAAQKLNLTAPTNEPILLDSVETL